MCREVKELREFRECKEDGEFKEDREYSEIYLIDLVLVTFCHTMYNYINLL